MLRVDRYSHCFDFSNRNTDGANWQKCNQTDNLSPLAAEFKHKFLQLRVEPVPLERKFQTNAFSSLMSAAARKSAPQLPDKLNEKDADNKIFNDLITFCESKKVAWAEKRTAKSFLEALKKLLWYIDAARHRFNKLPEEFDSKTLHKWDADEKEEDRVYNNWRKKKHSREKAENLKSETLQTLVDQLEAFSSHQWWSLAHFEPIVKPTTQLIQVVKSCLFELSEAKVRSQERHNSMEPVSGPGSGNATARQLAATDNVDPRFDSLSSRMAASPPFEPFPIHSLPEYPPDWPSRSNFMKDIELSRPAAVLSIEYNFGHQHYIWRVDPDDAEAERKSLAAQERARLQAPVFHTRAMKKQFWEKFGGLQQLNRTVGNAIYKFVTHDASKLPEDSAVERLLLLLETGDDIVWDRRVMNGGNQLSEFEPFWDAVSRVLSGNTAVDDRRKNDVGNLVNVWSINDLIEQATALLKAEGKSDAAIPSKEWVR